MHELIDGYDTGCALFSFVNLFCTLLETVSIIFVVFIRFVLTFLLHARVCGLPFGRCYED